MFMQTDWLTLKATAVVTKLNRKRNCRDLKPVKATKER